MKPAIKQRWKWINPEYEWIGEIISIDDMVGFKLVQIIGKRVGFVIGDKYRFNEDINKSLIYLEGQDTI